jgi:hypothetical protein
MKTFLGRKGQSTFEYAVVFAAIVAIIIVGVNRALRTQTCQIYQDVSNRMDQSSENLEAKFGVSVNFVNTSR